MGKNRKMDGRISARDLPPLKAWAFPEVGGAHVVRSPFKDKAESSTPVSRPDAPVSPGPLTVGEMEALREKARKEGLAQGLAEGLKQGRQKGLEAGRAEGYKAAHQKAEAEINDLKARLQSMLKAVQSPIEQQLEGLDQAVMRLVVDAAEAVTKRELATRPELLRQAVKESLDALPQQAQQLCFFVHPDDQALLQELCQQERATWEVAVDKDLSRGGLRVRGECSFLDYTVEKRFSQVIEQVLAGAGLTADKGEVDDSTG
ncbi:MAG: flagellar assembly protein FliH [Halopseudomonas sp.]